MPDRKKRRSREEFVPAEDSHAAHACRTGSLGTSRLKGGYPSLIHHIPCIRNVVPRAFQSSSMERLTPAWNTNRCLDYRKGTDVWPRGLDPAIRFRAVRTPT